MKKIKPREDVLRINPLYNEKPILCAAESAFSELYKNLEELKRKNNNPYSNTKCLVSCFSQMMSLAGLIKNGADENDILKACNGIFQSINFAAEAISNIEQELDNAYSAQESISKTKNPNVLDILEVLLKNLEEQLKTTEEIIANARKNEEEIRNKIENYAETLESSERDILVKQGQLEEAESTTGQDPAKILKELSENAKELNIEQAEELLKTAQQKLLELQKSKRKKEDIEKEIKDIQEKQKMLEETLKKQTNALRDIENERKNLEQEELFPLQRDVGAIKRMIENRSKTKEKKINADEKLELIITQESRLSQEEHFEQNNISFESNELPKEVILSLTAENTKTEQIEIFDKLVIITLDIITKSCFTASRRSAKTILFIMKNTNLLSSFNYELKHIKEVCKRYFSLGILNELTRGKDIVFYGLTEKGKNFAQNLKNELDFDENKIQNIMDLMNKAEMTGKIRSRK